MADTTRYVNTDNSVSGDGTTNEEDGSADSAYVSLSAAEAGEQGTIASGDRVIIEICGAADDTTPALFDGWTNNGNLILRANRSHAEGFNDGNNCWDGAFYVLDGGASSFYALRLQDPRIEVDGLQITISKASGSAACVAFSTGAALCTVKNCRLQADSGDGVQIPNSTTSIHSNRVYNNVVFNCGGTAFEMGGRASSQIVWCYNNLALDCGLGYYCFVGSGADGSTTWDIHNNYEIGCTTDYLGLDLATVVVNATYNGGDGASAPTGHDSNWIASISSTNGVDVTDPNGTGDYNDTDLQAVSSGKLDGAGLGSATDSEVPTDDLLGETRSTSAPTLGPFELVGGGGGGTILPHVLAGGLYAGAAA